MNVQTDLQSFRRVLRDVAEGSNSISGDAFSDKELLSFRASAKLTVGKRGGLDFESFMNVFGTALGELSAAAFNVRPGGGEFEPANRREIQLAAAQAPFHLPDDLAVVGSAEGDPLVPLPIGDRIPQAGEALVSRTRTGAAIFCNAFPPGDVLDVGGVAGRFRIFRRSGGWVSDPTVANDPQNVARGALAAPVLFRLRWVDTDPWGSINPNGPPGLAEGEWGLVQGNNVRVTVTAAFSGVLEVDFDGYTLARPGGADHLPLFDTAGLALGLFRKGGRIKDCIFDLCAQLGYIPPGPPNATQANMIEGVSALLANAPTIELRECLYSFLLSAAALGRNL